MYVKFFWIIIYNNFSRYIIEFNQIIFQMSMNAQSAHVKMVVPVQTMFMATRVAVWTVSQDLTVRQVRHTWVYKEMHHL
jgi:hypothetical protein